MPSTRVAIAGLGAIGRALARRLAEEVPGLTLACVAARDRAKAQAWLDAQRIICPLVGLDEFPLLADLAVECAPAAALEDICRPMLAAGKRVMVLSAGAFETPKLLMLSGIGPAAELASHGLPVLVDLPGVGAHLLATRHVLNARLLVTEGHTTVGAQTVTFKKHAHKRH